MARMSLDTELKMVLKNVVGIGSRGHVDNFNCDTFLLSFFAKENSSYCYSMVEGGQHQDIWYVLSNTHPNVRYLISEACCKFLTFESGKETIIYLGCRNYKAVDY